jgi:hypothetical protein
LARLTKKKEKRPSVVRSNFDYCKEYLQPWHSYRSAR